ncbi:MAG: GNAT family N-acetyltransferase [Rikenellaceae bacterium]
MSDKFTITEHSQGLTPSESPISLSPLSPSDAAYTLRVENDPEVWAYSDNTDAPYTLEEIKEFCSYILSNENTTSRRYVIMESGSRRGFIDVYDITHTEPTHFEGYISILIYPLEHRHSGIGTAALKSLESLLTQEFTHIELHALVPPQNTPSLKFFQKHNYTPTQKNERGHILSHKFTKP